MKLLLDTHTFIWLTGDTSRLSAAAFDALRDSANELWFSDASIWEMAIKIQLGKLTFPDPFPQKIMEALQRTQTSILPIATQHVTAVRDLPLHHRDPFDRLLVVQAHLENHAIVTCDSQFAPYGSSVCW